MEAGIRDIPDSRCNLCAFLVFYYSQTRKQDNTVNKEGKNTVLDIFKLHLTVSFGIC